MAMHVIAHNVHVTCRPNSTYDSVALIKQSASVVKDNIPIFHSETSACTVLLEMFVVITYCNLL